MSKKIVIGTAQFGMKYGISNKIGKIKSSEIFKILNYSKNNGIKYITADGKIYQGTYRNNGPFTDLTLQ